MVVFTCNHCGESIHKPKVEKHYQFGCRNNPVSLTCVDCFKDFRGDDFKVHTKCKTEDERYSAKGTFVNGDVKKGEVKQESWVEMIRSILDKDLNLTPGQRRLFETISSSSNVPRKKPKFLNFIKSSSGGRANLRDAEEVWNIIEKYKNEQAQSSQNGKHNSNKNGHSEIANNIENTSSETQANENGESQQKKKKKEIVNAENGEADKQYKNVDNENKKRKVEETDQEKLRKKKNKQDSQSVQEENVNVSSLIETNVGSEKFNKKKKKEKVNAENAEADEQYKNVDNENKKRKIEKTDQEKPGKKNSQSVQEENVNVSSVIETNVGSEKFNKKKKKEKVNAENAEADEQYKNVDNENKKRKIEETDQEKPGKKKNKQDSQSVQEENVNVSSVIETNVASEKFNFGEKILEILNLKKTISLKKLKKKVLNAYSKSTGTTEYSEKIMKKYDKQLKKLSNVQIDENNVTLLEA